jgi:sec-independent protein translocase protein TatB
MELFGVGAGEALLVLLITLIVVGPNRFPQIAREGGKWYRIARQYADEVMADVRGAVEELQQEVAVDEEDLKPIRDIGRDIRQIGSETRDTAAGDEPPAASGR